MNWLDPILGLRDLPWSVKALGILAGFEGGWLEMNLRRNKLDEQVALAATIRERPIRITIANRRGPWTGVDFSRFAPHVSGVYFEDVFDGIEQFESWTRLQSLTFGDVRIKFSIREMKQLARCSFHPRKQKLIGISEAGALRDLTLWGDAGLTGRDKCMYLQAYPELEHLTLIRPQCITLEGLKHLKYLRSLDVNYAAKLRSIDNLTTQNGLQSVQFRNCKNIESWLPLVGLRKLERLEVEFCAPMSSLEFVKVFSDLKTLSVIGTRVMDGRIRQAMENKSLVALRFDNKKSYDATMEAVERELSGRMQSS